MGDTAATWVPAIGKGPLLDHGAIITSPGPDPLAGDTSDSVQTSDPPTTAAWTTNLQGPAETTDGTTPPPCLR